MRRRRWLLCFMVVVVVGVAVEGCVPSCQCTMVGSKKKQKGGRKVECSKRPAPFTTLAHITFPPDTVHLDLTQNQLAKLKQGSFIQLSMLRKLNLSSNEISIIEPGAFAGLQNLRHLDLSHNKIGTINSSMFTGLPKLEKLWLNDNHINTIPAGTFNDLTVLRRIDFGSAYLRCDCHLRWVLGWAESKKVRVARETVCALPSSMAGRMLRKLAPPQLHCEHALQLPVFEIKPSHSQLVFQGDKLPFECRASVIHPRTFIAWVREGGRLVVSTNKSAGVFVYTNYSPDNTIVTHSLVVQNLDSSHQGVWSCQVTTPQGKVTKDVSVEVLDHNGLSCPAITHPTPKGTYAFPKMLSGIQATLPCQVGGQDKMVTYTCDRSGVWRDLNTSACSFTSDVTRSLQKLAQEAVNASEVVDYMGRLQQAAMTSRRRLVSDVMPTDVRYLASILQQRLLPLAYASQEVSQYLLWLSSNVSALPAPVLQQAQQDSGAPKQVLEVLQNFSRRGQVGAGLGDWSQSSRNIALVLLRQVPLTASRVHCSLRRPRRAGPPWLSNRRLSCSRLGNSTQNRHLWSQNTDVSIDLPASLLQDAGMVDENHTNIYITVFRNSRLFPPASTSPSSAGLPHSNWTVVSSVVSVSVGHPVPNLTEPVVLVLRTGPTSNPIAAAYWDFSAKDGVGDWRTDGCKILERKGNHTLLHVYHLSYFAIIEDLSEKPSVLVLEPVVYVGSCICILCLLLLFLTYTCSFKWILCPKKLKHSVINICVAVGVLLLGFVLGINRTDMQVPCQVTGIGIHYFTLAATFWITITANNMYKKFTKADRPPSPPPEPVSMPLPPKPILRFYFLGWGVPIIICGITAAVNLSHYIGHQYCFLAWEPSLGAFYAPMGLLIILNLIFFLRISCVVHSQSAGSLNESDETEEVHTNEIELVPSQADTQLETIVQPRSHRSKPLNSRRSMGGQEEPEEEDEEEEDSKSTISVMDAQRRPITQLRALAATLLLWIVTWVCGAMAVAQPFKHIVPYQRLIFSYLYGVTSTAFGVFMLTYYSFTRLDACGWWKRLLGLAPAVSYTGPVSTEPPPPTSQTPPPPSTPQANGSVVKSNSNMDVSVYSAKSSNIAKACNLKNNVSKQANNSNINLVSLPASSLTEVSCGSGQEGYPNFYNPRQNGAARKFWQKNRQHKVLNKDVNKELNASLTDSLSQGPGSEANTHLSIQIQIQAKERGSNKRLSSGYDNTSSSSNPNLNRHHNHHSLNGLPPYTVNSTTTSALISAHPHAPSPLGYRSDGGAYNRGGHSPSPSRSQHSPAGSQRGGASPHAPQHQRAPSSSSLGPHPSAFTPVQPRSNNNSLPRLAQPQSANPSPTPALCPDLSQDCGVFVDGPGVGVGMVAGPPSEQYVPQPAPPYTGYETRAHPNYLPAQGCNIPVSLTYSPFGAAPSALARSISPVVSGMHGFIYYPNPHHHPSHSPHPHLPMSGDSSDASSRYRRHSRYSNHSSSRNLPRAGLNDRSKSPGASDVTATPSSLDPATPESDTPQCQVKKNRSIDSDHHSDPTHRKKHRARDRYAQRRGQGGGMTKQRSLGWEEQFKGRPAKVAYAYVNHHYRDRVMTKLIKQASESDELAQKAFWLPRSLSEYDRLTQAGFCDMADDTSSSSDEDSSFDNVWLPQNSELADIFKKETSV